MRMFLVLALLAIGCSEEKKDATGEASITHEGDRGPETSNADMIAMQVKVDIDRGISDVEPFGPPISEASVLISPEGYYLASIDGRTQKIALCGTDFDREGLADALCQLRESGVLTLSAALEIAAEGSVTYQSIISTMDRAITMGIMDVDFVTTEEMSSTPRRQGAGVELVEPLCGRSASVCSAGVRDGLEFPSEAMRAGLKQAPVIVVTDSEIRFNGSVVISLQDLPQEPGEVIPGLEKALREQQLRFLPDPTIADAEREELRRTVILQGDRDTTARVMNQILATTTEADYTNVMFAVNMKK